MPVPVDQAEEQEKQPGREDRNYQRADSGGIADLRDIVSKEGQYRISSKCRPIPGSVNDFEEDFFRKGRLCSRRGCRVLCKVIWDYFSLCCIKKSVMAKSNSSSISQASAASISNISGVSPRRLRRRARFARVKMYMQEFSS